MAQQFQVFVDARGDLWAAGGMVIDKLTGNLFEVGPLTIEHTLKDTMASSYDEAVEVPGVQGSKLLGGSGRNVLVSGFPTGDGNGIYRPTRSNMWENGRWVLEATGSSAATISDGVDVVGELTTGGDAPGGDYVATTYGEDTYNSSSTFTANAVKEDGWPGGLADLDVTVNDGRAQGGTYTAVDAENWVSEVDTDWTLELTLAGVLQFSFDGVVVAERSQGSEFDPCGELASTTDGEFLNPVESDEEIEEVDPGSNPFGTLNLEIDWAGTGMSDLDVGVSFLGTTVGFAYGGSTGYLTYTGDDTGDGPETVEIDLAAAWDAGDITMAADVLVAADWYPPSGGSGPAVVNVTYSVGGYSQTFQIRPGNDVSPAETEVLALRVLADGSIGRTGEPWTATVRVFRRMPAEGVVYLSLTVDSGTRECTAADGPFWAAELPAGSATAVYYLVATSDGDGGLRQLHSGPVLW